VKRVKKGENVIVFLNMYEYGALKPMKVILREGKENHGGVKQTWMYMWKCDNETPIQLL
jgi:hypothetical protein